jgi:hypothetical protein
LVREFGFLNQDIAFLENVIIRGYPSMRVSLKINSGTFSAVDIKNNNLKSPFERADQAK